MASNFNSGGGETTDLAGFASEFGRTDCSDQDNDPPVINASVEPPPNATGWNNTDVTVSFECTDTASGIKTCPDPVRVSSEGQGQVISGTAVDFAGNSATVSVTLNIDKTPPRIEIYSPSDDFVTNSALVTVTGMINDNGADAGINMLEAINGDNVQVIVKSPIYETAVQVKDGIFLAEDVVLPAGSSSIDVIAKDQADNTSISKITGNFIPTLPSNGANSLRVLTYNTAFLSFTVDMPLDITISPNSGNFSGLDDYDRATKIAQGILRGAQEVVVLNEVFGEFPKNRLVTLLKGTYNHYISKLRGPALMEAVSLNALVDIAPFPIPVPDIPLIGDYLVHPGDSGLMIFSRYPFLPLTGPNPPNDSDCQDETCEFAGKNNGSSLSPQDFAFHIFNACADFDCFASKGVGLVKIDTPNQPSYVAFTHLQADYPGVVTLTRAKRNTQYQEIKQELLKNSIPAEELVGFPVYLAGDLNTPGANKADTPPSEWWDLFHPLTSDDNFFACGNNGPCFEQFGNNDLLTDSWGFETSANDPGITNEDDNARLDYILHNSADDTLCMQHSMIAWEVAESGALWYSDHYPIRADFNKKTKWCSANDDAPNPYYGTELVEFPDTSCDEDPNTSAPPCVQDITYGAEIINPGNFQWYKITQPGSYSIKITYTVPGENVAFDVYHNSDLSRPISPFIQDEHPDWSLPFSMLEPPYYIRVYAVDSSPQPKPDRTAANRGYNINFHQHLCRYPEDGCFLPPGALEYPYKWPEITLISKVLDLWFKFKTAGVKNGHLDSNPNYYPAVKLQQEALQLSNLDCMKGMTLEEFDKNIPPNLIQEIPFIDVEIDDDHDWHDDGRKDERYVAPELGTDTNDILKVYYVVMHRKDIPDCSPIIPTWTRFETTLSYFIPGLVRCFLQADDSGVGEDDEIRFYTYFDAATDPSWASQCDNNWCPKRIFDEPKGQDYIDNESSLRGYFVNRVHLDLHEEEDDDPDILLAHDGNIDPLNPWYTSLKDVFGKVFREYTDNPNSEEADYEYYMYFNICHEEADCRN
ncbi:MAG: hypothetical protein E4H46_00380 [Desulfobacterales bacterium]|nr:MAG: hypothetical protein E4H46_00380 [Desulfobacterales bacterium]